MHAFEPPALSLEDLLKKNGKLNYIIIISVNKRETLFGPSGQFPDSAAGLGPRPATFARIPLALFKANELTPKANS